MHDIAVIVVSIPGEPEWLGPCARSVAAHTGTAGIDLVVVENDGSGAAEAHLDGLGRVVRCENRGFGHANNRGWATCDARYALFLNPDTEIVAGTLADLVAALDDRPRLGIAGARQVLPNGSTFPTMRRFPSPARAWGEALGAERLAERVAGRFRERLLDPELYESEQRCDWLSGSFLAARRDVLEGTGGFDERFFLYSEETDWCLRAKQTGWEVGYLPVLTIVHHIHAGKGLDARMAAQFAHSSRLYAHKHFSALHRRLYLGGLGAAALRRRRHAGPILRVLAGRQGSPFAAADRARR